MTKHHSALGAFVHACASLRWKVKAVSSMQKYHFHPSHGTGLNMTQSIMCIMSRLQSTPQLLNTTSTLCEITDRIMLTIQLQMYFKARVWFEVETLYVKFKRR